MIFLLLFIVAMCVAGFTEWLKNFLPAKVKENKIIMAVIAGVLGAVVAAAVAFIPGLSPTLAAAGLILKLLFIVGVVALTQTSYTLLFQTFKAVKAALQKFSITNK
jgi:uncharacterized membrane protein YeaQ/YmgE (transglycosylase-associated protein family)